MRQLLLDARFRQYAIAKLLQLAGQNALIYGLFILVIEKQESSLSTSLFVLCSVLPSVLLSIPGGVVADATPRKMTILLMLVARLAIILMFIRFDVSLPLVLGLTLLIWAIYQFYSPAENAALIAVTPPGMMVQSNAVMYIVSLIAQLGGAGFIAPLALKTFDASGLFVVTLLLVFGGLFMFAGIRNLSPAEPPKHREGLLRSFSFGLRYFRADPLATRAMLQFVLLSSATTMVIVAVPRYLEDVLSTGVINAVYIFSPGAIGVAFGLAVAPLMTRLLGGPTVTLLGFIAFAGALAALAAVDPLSEAMREWAYFEWARETFNVNLPVATTMVIVPFGGLGIALVNVSSRALIYERAETARLGQIFATKSAIGSVASIIPTLTAGVLVDRVDVRYFLGAIAALLIASLIPLLSYGRSRARIPAELLMQEVSASESP
ncbi:MAG: MFS transporter [Dehalococcoidia bacterium]